MINKSKIGSIGAGLYLLLVLVAAVTGLTLPWSLLMVYLVNPFLSETAMRSETAGLIMCAISALLNAGIIYLVLGTFVKTVEYKQAYK
jgi:hypothetical protein